MMDVIKLEHCHVELLIEAGTTVKEFRKLADFRVTHQLAATR